VNQSQLNWIEFRNRAPERETEGLLDGSFGRTPNAR